VFFGRDPELARALMAGKVEIRRLEAASSERHLKRVRALRSETLETSTLHLDILRDLKRINAHLASVAVPILEQMGELSESRLVQQAPGLAHEGQK
jgi:phosphate:Na+ symporter